MARTMHDVDGEKIHSFGPNMYATPERLRARFNAFYQTKHCVQYAAGGAVTKDDLNRYAAKFPEEGDKLRRMYGLGRFTGLGTAAGFFGGTAYAFRITRSPPLLVVSALLSTVSSHLVSDDIGTWIYGTYKFDIAGTNEKYLKWVNENRQPAS